MAQCKICNSISEKIFEKIVLQKYNSSYYRCSQCSFVQTDEPIWLKEAYNQAITSLDIGLPKRNFYFSNEIKKIIDSCFPESKNFLDYAGGYGLFVRLMRDLGFDFYRQDDYCENLFANHFDINDINTKKFDVVTAFEVFEHFNNPLEEIEKIFNYSDNVIFSTEISPENNQEIENWWYITQETGQHIAFYSKKAMEIIAEKFNKNYYSKNGSLHLLTSKKLNTEQIDFAFNDITIYEKKYFWSKRQHLNFTVSRESLLDKDFQYVKNILNNPGKF
ncbi:class I SAM-dependent methyltransferase [Flavobacterium sp.]|uniref:class I SAM-dependent methyltransferase n=1 Tax=Flavobacterium sp. TaxID=239 RepID=UPI00286D3D1C|nr:class I SAM-dependent methyltransferase [Flavobacterium sp.]